MQALLQSGGVVVVDGVEVVGAEFDVVEAVEEVVVESQHVSALQPP